MGPFIANLFRKAIIGVLKIIIETAKTNKF